MPTGSSLGATSSAPISITGQRWPVLSAALLSIALGLVIVLADSLIRLPLHLPGWRGLIMVPLLIATNRVSGQRWGATVAGIAAAGFCLGMGAPMRFGPFAYLLPGLVTDAVLLLPFGLACAIGAGVLANLARLVTALGSGSALPGHHSGPMAWISHAAFGAVAGLLFWGISRMVRR